MGLMQLMMMTDDGGGDDHEYTVNKTHTEFFYIFAKYSSIFLHFFLMTHLA